MFAEDVVAAVELAVVRRGLFGLISDMILRRQQVEFARRRGETLIALAATVTAAEVAARVCSRDSDGGEWSMEIVPTSVVSNRPVMRR